MKLLFSLIAIICITAAASALTVNYTATAGVNTNNVDYYNTAVNTVDYRYSATSNSIARVWDSAINTGSEIATRGQLYGWAIDSRWALQLNTFSFGKAGYASYTRNTLSGTITIDNPEYAVGQAVGLELMYAVESRSDSPYSIPAYVNNAIIISDGTNEIFSEIFTANIIETITLPVIAGSTYYLTMYQHIAGPQQLIAVPTYTALVADFSVVPEPTTILLFGAAAFIRFKKR